MVKFRASNYQTQTKILFFLSGSKQRLLTSYFFVVLKTLYFLGLDGFGPTTEFDFDDIENETRDNFENENQSNNENEFEMEVDKVVQLMTSSGENNGFPENFGQLLDSLMSKAKDEKAEDEKKRKIEMVESLENIFKQNHQQVANNMMETRKPKTNNFKVKLFLYF